MPGVWLLLVLRPLPWPIHLTNCSLCPPSSAFFTSTTPITTRTKQPFHRLLQHARQRNRPTCCFDEAAHRAPARACTKQRPACYSATRQATNRMHATRASH
ncbi:hypothetical protein JOL62DRAFT_7848 [Phyllosticta paracitricarpa]|uniref:Secreted protein n=1 Tax=Phyllosticta paracitricarpa TaxID=2016321 RepID=A0ABR1NJV6_9PEZI